MAILEVRHSWVKNASIGFDSGGRATIRGTRGGHVVTDVVMSDMAILLDPAFLNSLTQHPDHAAAKISNASITFDDSPLIPKWQVDFETRAPTLDSTGQRPDNVPPEWGFEIGTHSTVQAIDRTYYGTPIRLITGETYDPPLQAELADVVYIFSTEQIPLNRRLISRYRNCVNSDWFDNYPPGCCRMGEIRAKAQYIPGQPAKMSCVCSVLIRDPDNLPPDVEWEDAWSIREPSRGYLIRDYEQNGQPKKPWYEAGAFRRARQLDSSGNEKADAPENYVDTPVLHAGWDAANDDVGRRITDPRLTNFDHWAIYRPRHFGSFFTDMLT